MFTDRLDESEPCLWDAEKESCSHCLERQTRTCRDVPESAVELVRRLLRLREEYHSFDAADPRRPYNVKCMSILVREFRGLDSGAAKRRRRQATSTVEGPSMKRRRPASRHVAKTVDLVSETESTKDGPSEFPRSSSPVRTVLSRVENEVANVRVSLDHLTTCLTSGTKALRGSTETGLANLTSSIDCLTDVVSSGFRSVVETLRSLHTSSSVMPSSVTAPSVVVPSVVVPNVPATPEPRSSMAGSPPSRPRLGRPRGTPSRR
ncbi:conserved hypothetical protein [Coccidioides posadasii str. Silveira]|nr:conserved hypothetical protein [Coccidioides posadasii str. Silveira]